MSFSAFVNKWIYQMAHIGWGGLLTLSLCLHIGWWGQVSVIGFAAIKEGIFDPLTEDKTTRGSGWQDFLFWSTGTILGILLWKI